MGALKILAVLIVLLLVAGFFLARQETIDFVKIIGKSSEAGARAAWSELQEYDPQLPVPAEGPDSDSGDG